MSKMTYNNTQQQGKDGVAVRLSALEQYARLLTVLETLAILENWRNAANTPLFKEIVRVFCSRFQINQALRSLMPHVEVFKTAAEVRSQQNRWCFGEAHR